MHASAVLDAADIEPIAYAVSEDRVTTLARVLADLSADGTFDDPKFFADPHAEHHTRRLLWRDPLDRFVIVAMTWAPNQSTPLHDHGGLWCAEIVIDGTMQERSYRAVEHDQSRGTRFAYAGDTLLPQRSVAMLVPPYEHHAYSNATSAVAHTVHVYAGLMESCTAYTQADDNWWTAQRHTLLYDA